MAGGTPAAGAGFRLRQELDSIKSDESTVKGYSSDAAGRTTAVTTGAGTTTLSYDYEDRVTGITYPNSTTNSFTYNGLDTRVGKVDSSGTATYLRDGADVTDDVLSDGTISYTPGISERVGCASTFDLPDYLGSLHAPDELVAIHDGDPRLRRLRQPRVDHRHAAKPVRLRRRHRAIRRTRTAASSCSAIGTTIRAQAGS